LAEENVIKITDVSVTKEAHMLCITADGSSAYAYMAPEVLLSSEIQTDKIDIYSLSLIFWEMWFGKDIADEITDGLLGYGYHGNAMEELVSQIARTDGWRPPLSSPTRPPEMLTDVLKRGWATDPEKRPSANEFGNTLKQFLKNNL
jgi:serine/threonine protein kinase